MTNASNELDPESMESLRAQLKHEVVAEVMAEIMPLLEKLASAISEQDESSAADRIKEMEDQMKAKIKMRQNRFPERPNRPL